MKAIVYTKFGSPDMLQLKEVNQPVYKDDEVLVKVEAASVNSWDWDLVIGRPYIYRLLFGIFRPRYKIIGCDIAGRVEAVGQNVTRLKPGDEVFGDISGVGFGGFAEYVCVREDVLAIKPPELHFEEAAAIPQAGVLALQGLNYQGQIHPGQKVLINGAGGGVGTFAVQMAKLYGAEVTAVDSFEKLKMLQTLGADFVMDRKTEDYTKSGKQYDLILDVIAKRSLKNYKRALAPKGVFVIIGGSVSTLLQTALFGKIVSGKSGKKLGLLAHQPNIKDLEYIAMLCVTGKIKPVIDKVFPLSELPEAIRYLGEGHVQGKLVIRM